MRTLLQQSRRHDSWHWQDRGGRSWRGNKGVFYNNKSSNSLVKVVPYNKSSTGSTQLPSLAPSSMQLHHHLSYKCITIINAIIASPFTIQVYALDVTIFNAIASPSTTPLPSPSTIHLHHHLHCICIITMMSSFLQFPVNLSLSLSLSPNLFLQWKYQMRLLAWARVNPTTYQCTSRDGW